MREVESAIRTAPVLKKGLEKMLRFIFLDEEMIALDVAVFLFFLLFVIPLISDGISGILNLAMPDASFFSINFRDYVSYIVTALVAIVVYRVVFLKDIITESKCRFIAEWDRVKKNGELVKVISTSKGKVYLYRLGDSYAIIPESYDISLKDWESLENFFRENKLSSKNPDLIAEVLSSV